jgi:hypothetical protein
LRLVISSSDEASLFASARSVKPVAV